MGGGVLMRDTRADHHGVKSVPGPVLPMRKLCICGEIVRCRPPVIMQPATGAGRTEGPRGRHAGQAETEDPDLCA